MSGVTYVSGRVAAISVRVVWLGLTVVFGFGRYVAGHSWNELLADYPLFSGRVWLLFLVWVLVLSYIVYKAG